MHVVADGHHDAPVPVANGPPLGNVAVFFIGYAAGDVLLAWYLKFFVDVVEGVVYLVAVRKILDLRVG